MIDAGPTVVGETEGVDVVFVSDGVAVAGLIGGIVAIGDTEVVAVG